jgi:Uma2 family endonuclease
MAEPAVRRMTVDEFLQWDDSGYERQELIDGCVVAMTASMPGHALLATGLAAEIRSALRGQAPCRAYGEAGIALPHRNDACYIPDLVVSCEALQPQDRLLRGPVLIVEILSPSTVAADRQIKVPDYRRIPSVKEILLIDSERLFAEILRRDGERWITEIVQGRDATLALSAVPLTIAMSELYEGIPLPEPQAKAAGADG